LLLFLMLLYNITGGLFPDPKIGLAIDIQTIIAYGTGFLMASYFPFYFYKGFGIKALRWHSFYGVPLFLMLPYVIFFVVVYAINGKLNVDIRYGMIVPFIYALVLLWVMFRAIRQKYEAERNSKRYFEEIAMYCAVTPWLALAFFGLVEESQLTEVLCTNTGIISISILFIWRSIKDTRLEHQKLLNILNDGLRLELFQENCLRFGLTKTEVSVVQMIYKGMSNKEIGEENFVSEETVKKHIQNIFKKTRVKNRTALIHTLQYHHD
jgi:DNA-binding CsgD family transcriptional regulator